METTDPDEEGELFPTEYVSLHGHQMGFRRAGRGPTLLLLHGIAGSSRTWVPAMELLQQGHAVLAPDLPGHGGSARLPRYSFGGLAAAIANGLPDAGPYVVVGHSLGGVVAVALGSGWFGIDIVGVVAVGVKVDWSHEDLARAALQAVL